MADEAIVRIKIDEGQGGSSPPHETHYRGGGIVPPGGGGPGGGSGGQWSGSREEAAAWKRLQAAERAIEKQIQATFNAQKKANDLQEKLTAAANKEKDREEARAAREAARERRDSQRAFEQEQKAWKREERSREREQEAIERQEQREARRAKFEQLSAEKAEAKMLREAQKRLDKEQSEQRKESARAAAEEKRAAEKQLRANMAEVRKLHADVARNRREEAATAKQFADDTKKAHRANRTEKEKAVAAAAAALSRPILDAEPVVDRQRDQALEDDFRRANRDLARRQKNAARAKHASATNRESTIRGAAGLVGQVAGGAGGSIADLTGAALTGGGPMAIASAAITAAKALREAMESAIVGVGQFARTAISASDSTSAYVHSLGGAIGQIPLLGQYIGNFISQLGGIMQEMDGLASRFGQYSPRIAMAEAQGEVIHTLNEIRRAQEAGPALEAYVRARTELQQQIEDQKVRMMERIMPVVIAGMGSLQTILTITEGAASLLATVAELIPGLGEDVTRVRRELEKMRESAEETGALADMRKYLESSPINPKDVVGSLGRL